MSNAHIHPLFQAILAPYTPPQCDARWADVSKAFNEHTACDACEHKRITKDEGSEGGKHGIAYYGDCSLGQHRSDHPGMCPAINPTDESEEQP